MDPPVDISFYLGEQAKESLSNLDVPVSNGQIVSINLTDELPDDPNELISFLEGENCSKKYWISIATAYVQLNKLDEALTIINHALKLAQFSEDEKISFHSYLVWLYLKFISVGVDKENYLIKANMEISQLSQQEASNNTSNILSQAVLYLFKDRQDKALDIFDKLLRIDPNNCFALLGKAQIVLHKTKHYANALKLYQQVLVLNPMMKPDPRIGIGLCFYGLKDYTMALEAWNRALDINPDNLKVKILLNLAKFSRTFTNSLSDDEFIENYQSCISQMSTYYKESANDSVILLTLVSFYFSKQKYDVVQALVAKIVKNLTGYVGDSDPIKFNNFTKLTKFQSVILSQCAYWLGRIEFTNSNFTQSSKYFQESIKLNDTNLPSKLGLGLSQHNRGSLEESVMTYESILKSNGKCLEVNYSLGMLYAKQKSRRKQEQAIEILERYIKLSNNASTSTAPHEDLDDLSSKEPVALNAYLVLSKLYEGRDIGQSLTYLNKAIESRKKINQDVPLEVYNNIGVFQFMKQNYSEAAENFELALKKTDDKIEDADGDLNLDLPGDLKVTLTFNLARTKEISNQTEAIEIYETLLKECPHYFSAKLRILFLDCITTQKRTKKEIKEEIEALLALDSSDLEVRTFYGWFMKSFGKKLGLKPDADTNLQKDTLVDYDSHDCYALISLANIYCIMARDLKAEDAKTQDEKKRKYYIRAIELFAKVLSIDPKDVYAAQGLAIAYIENKESNKGLDILRKIRDSLNDISIYLNLGHVLVDLKQYGKAIENYELASSRFTDEKDSKIHSYLGKAWFLRANNEKNLNYYLKAIEYTEKALSYATGSHSSLKFNLAYVQFQLAEYLTKLPVGQRVLTDIEKGIQQLKQAIEILNELSSDSEVHPPYPKSELKARATLGSATLLSRLNAVFEETKEHNSQIAEKLEVAKKIREEETAAKLKIQEEQLQAQRLKEEELSKEREKLQEQAQQWAEEARMNVIVDENDDDDKFDDEPKEKEKKKRGKKAEKSETAAKGKGKKRGKRKAIIDDSEEEELSNNESEEESSTKRKVEENDEDEDDRPKKKKSLSKEFIEDSDDDLEDDLFNEENGEKNGDEEQNGEAKEEDS
ncbi:TPR-like protein [Suhomyces tanzawaensis NRRL Y-17324]|uniref:TPR-like protein n=1 Tax=Suhomyces tanzawaensis NRRL Y-17324 TaxID=984487 RepID=A0A1E4SS05_9ASCO|nr:TPR-like protein [Suhomyces tanzawaensis NRRL Y-17324]ODV82296.1 TPR-like protein [Suhomyces tanzawaensis NRRL Y-17324]